MPCQTLDDILGLYIESLFDTQPDKKLPPITPKNASLAPSEPRTTKLCNHQDLTSLRNALGNKLAEYELTLQELEKALGAKNYAQAMDLVDLLEELIDLELY